MIRHLDFLDGIRGIAILLVVLFHIDFLKFGYLGVDIFFILSGFLITLVIDRNVKDNKFTFLDFYKRRVFRIFPAAIVVVLLVFFVGYKTMFYNEFLELIHYIASIIKFQTNTLAMQNINYFDLGVKYKPLIHYWSLAVELQFYIIMPIITYIFLKKRKYKILTFVLLLIIVSSLLYTSCNEGNTKIYYSTLSRIYEFASGSLIFALVTYFINNITLSDMKKKILEICSIILFFIFIYIIEFNLNLSIQLRSIIVTVIISLLIISMFIKRNQFIGKILSNKILIFLGLISYSFYLIHYPVLAFCRIILDRELSNMESIALIFAAFSLSILSYYFIEKPFLNKKNKKRTYILISLIIILLTLMYNKNYFLKNVHLKDNAVQYYLNYLKDNHPDIRHSRIDNTVLINPYSYKDKYNDPAEVALWGDSHMNQISLPLAYVFNENNISVNEYSVAGCPPVLNYKDKNPNRKCEENANVIYKQILRTGSIKTVVLFAYWQNYFKNDTSFKKKFLNTINELLKANKKVYIIDPTPIMPYNIPMKIAREIKIFGAKEASNICVNKDNFKAKIEDISIFLNSIKGIKKVDISKYLVSKNDDNLICANYGNIIYYRDDNHLSLTFAKTYANKIANDILGKK